MLNELKSLADSLRAAGVSGEEWDDKFKEIKAKIRKLDRDGLLKNLG